MIKELDLNNNTNEIVKIFSENFNEIYVFMEKDTKNELLKLVPTLFKKWYYSTLVDDTVLSPANILCSYNSDEEKNSTFSVNLSVDIDKKGRKKFVYKSLLYSIENHPVIDDLKETAKKCILDAPVNENGSLTKDYALEIANTLSLKDHLYAEYLFNLLDRFGLLRQLTSIHSHRVQLRDNADIFFKKDNEVLLRLIIDESIKIFAEKISKIIESLNKTISYETVYSFLQKPITIDEIFEKIYSSIGVDINKIWEASEKNEMSPYEASILSSTFHIGLILDKYFMCVFGNYLNLIEPFYAMPIDFKHTINSLSEIITLKKDVGVELFTPCSYFKLTNLGKELIYGYDDSKNLIKNIPSNVGFDEVLNAILFRNKEMKAESLIDMEECINRKVIEFKVSYSNNMDMWKIIEVSENISLEELGTELCLCFAFENIFDYTFIIPDKNLFPVEYVSRFSKKPPLNRTEKYTLKDLDIQAGKVFTFNPRLEKDLKLTIECISVKKEIYMIQYPRIKKQSDSITKEEEDLDLI